MCVCVCLHSSCVLYVYFFMYRTLNVLFSCLMRLLNVDVGNCSVNADARSFLIVDMHTCYIFDMCIFG